MSPTNITLLSNLTNEQFIIQANKVVSTPSLLTLFIGTHILFLLLGFSVVENRKKFWTIWIPSFILSGILLLALIFLPSSFQTFFNFFK